jgi:VCBS repeat-containing protein
LKKKPQDEIIKLNPGESKTITKKFEISPDLIKDNLYSLYLTKQSGTHDYYTVIVEAPRGYRISSDDFQPLENLAFFQGQINKDLQLDLEILPDQLAPRLILQQNTELNHISLHFNEDLNQDFASDPFSYQITDLNAANSKTDQITIRRVETTSKDVHLYLNGQTNQPEEHYSVRLKNLRDTHGNILTDRQITVVQRLN